MTNGFLPRLGRRCLVLVAATFSMAPGLAVASSNNPLLVGGADRPTTIIPPGRAAVAAPGAHVQYFGGPIVSNVSVTMVLWGRGSYAPFVTDVSAPSLASFFEAVTSGPYLAALSEYDTNLASVSGTPGTDQHLGRGTFAGRVAIEPAPANGGARIDDAQIVAELAAQLTTGSLSPPERNAAGGTDTVYMVYFPAGKTVTLRGETSCVSFCAYHGAFDWRGRSVYYAVLPDMSAGSGCDTGCGSGSPFATATSVSSHELAEAITDPEVSLAAAAAPPLAWYDPDNGEIGDICNGLDASIRSADGTPYVVQKWWSNAERTCVAPGGEAPAIAARSAVPDVRVAMGEASLEPQLASASLPSSERPSRPQGFESEPSNLPMSSGSSFTIEEENDALAVARHPTDAFYTQGLRISSRWASTPHFAPDGREVLGFAFGQNIYTPSDIRASDLETLRHDRPYAGWLYAAFLYELILPRVPFSILAAGAPPIGTLDAEVALGTTGPRSGAGAVQTSFHRFLRDVSGSATNPPDPAGWSVYQTANRYTADLSLRYQFDAVRASAPLGRATTWTGSGFGLSVSPRARLDVGTTFDAASLGLEVRTGLMESPRGSGSRPSFPFELYVYARGDGRRVVYNGFIEGPLLNGVTPLVSIARKVGDLDVGAVARVGKVELGYAQLWRTNELSQVPSGSSTVHRVGQVRLSLLY
jgi:hypothetical protein